MNLQGPPEYCPLILPLHQHRSIRRRDAVKSRSLAGIRVVSGGYGCTDSLPPTSLSAAAFCLSFGRSGFLRSLQARHRRAGLRMLLRQGKPIHNGSKNSAFHGGPDGTTVAVMRKVGTVAPTGCEVHHSHSPTSRCCTHRSSTLYQRTAKAETAPAAEVPGLQPEMGCRRRSRPGAPAEPGAGLNRAPAGRVRTAGGLASVVSIVSGNTTSRLSGPGVPSAAAPVLALRLLREGDCRDLIAQGVSCALPGSGVVRRVDDPTSGCRPDRRLQHGVPDRWVGC